MSDHSRASSNGLPSPPRTPPHSPSFPYLKGAIFKAKSHEPPSTFEMGYWQYTRPLPNLPDNQSQLEWCLAHPPTPGTTRPEDTRCVEIVKDIRTGESCGAQIVLTADGLVAKIYDPLYYTFENPEWPDEKINVTDNANEDYITEAAAYRTLLGTNLHGSITPKYFGSWTLDVATETGDEQQTREVRMILLEDVPGISMHNVDPSTLNNEERENIMIKLIEADIDLRFAGVRHDDLEPRNVILSKQDTSKTFADPGLRLCIIDYARCGLSRDTGRQGPIPDVHNPLFFWAGTNAYSQWDWLPSQSEATEWMWRVWGDGGTASKYLPAERDADDKFGRPKRLRTE